MTLPLTTRRLIFPLSAALLVLSAPQAFTSGSVWAEAPTAAEAPTQTLPNILVILVDDMGYGDAKCFNPDSKIDTPTINELAAEGMRFTDAHAPGPLCHMSRYGLMTGCYPFRTNVNRWKTEPLIRKGQTTIASHLKSAGYYTAMVGKWHLGFQENGYDQPLPGGPIDVGFDEFFGIRASTDIPPYFYIRDDRAVETPSDSIQANNSEGWSPIQGEFWRAGGIAPDLSLHDVLPTFADEAVRVIDEHAVRNQEKAQPLLLYLALPAPHTPWLPSELYLKASDVSMYGDFVMMVDAMIGTVLDRLDQRDMRENTLVIFTSDNGPVWYPKDKERFNHDSCGGLNGMKGDALEAGHRMPMIVRWLDQVKPGTVTDQLVSFTDFLATFAELTQQELPEDAGPDSISFLPTLLEKDSGDSPRRRQLVLQSGRGHFAVRDENWKWISELGSGGFTAPSKVKPSPDGPTSQLYDLSEDLSEQTNLAIAQPDRVEAMQAILKSERAKPSP